MSIKIILIPNSIVPLYNAFFYLSTSAIEGLTELSHSHKNSLCSLLHLWSNQKVFTCTRLNNSRVYCLSKKIILVEA